jgi:FkbM family methyltransferase
MQTMFITVLFAVTALSTACQIQPEWKFYSQSREDVFVHDYFCGQTGLTFVEIGAFDGVVFSNTKFLEDSLNWSGVLIEAQPESAAKLKQNRVGPRVKTYASAICKEGVDYLTFLGPASPVSGDINSMNPTFKSTWHPGDTNTYKVPCKPISSIIADAGVSHIDFFSLDVEGAELKVLETFDWNVTVTLWVVELDGGNKEKDEAVRALLRSHGYEKTETDIRSFCCAGCDCIMNEAFERPGVPIH